MLRGIELRNFKAHEELSAQLVEGINFVYGPNGAGKTSLLEAIAVALYGSKWLQRTKAKWGDLLRRGAREGEIRLSLVGVDGAEYTIVRRFTASSSVPSATYALADGKPVARGDQDVTAVAARAVGLSIDEFANLAYIRQGELRRLLAEADYLDRLFRLDEFDDLDEVVREAVAEAGKKRANAEGRRDALERSLAELRARIAKLEAERAEAERKAEELRPRAEEYKKVEEEYQRLRARSAALEQETAALRRESESLEEELVSLDIEREKKGEELAELARLEAELASLPSPDPALEQQYHEAQRVLQALTSMDPAVRSFRPEELEALKAEREELIARRAELNNKLAMAREVARIASRAREGRCPVCGSPLSPETAQRHAEEAKRLEEELRRAEARLMQLEVELRRLEKLREEYLRYKEYLPLDVDSIKRRVEELRRAYEAQREAERRRAEIEARLKRRRALEEELKALDSRRAEAEARLGEAKRRLAEAEQELAQLRPKLAELEGLYAELRAAYEEWLKASARAEELAKQLAAAKAEAEKAEAELGRARAEAEAHAKAEERGKALRAALRDIKPLARKMFIDAVNAELNSAFLRLRHKEELRSASLAQEEGRYYVVVSRADGQRFLHTSLSLGEQNLVALALRVALAKALLGRPPFLILDEPTEHLDEVHRRRIVELVRDLARDVRTVIVTSHLGEFEEVADNRIDL
nr:MAG: purine NTPase [Thermoproteus sp. AZ2]